MTKKRAVITAAVSAFLGAFIPTLAMLKMMADNNNNGEVYDPVTGSLDVGYVLSISAIYYVPTFLLIFVLVFGIANLGNNSVDDF